MQFKKKKKTFNVNLKQLNVFAFDGKRISSDKKFKFNLLSDKMNGYVRETHN
jgi:hypothetical protein